MMKKITLLLVTVISLIGTLTLNAQTVLFNEDFATGIPATWQNVENIVGCGFWTSVTTDTLNGIGISTTTVANGYANFNADFLGNDLTAEDADLITPSFSCVGQSVVNLTFENVFAQFAIGQGKVSISNNNGLTWTDIYTVGPTIPQNNINGNPDVQNINISTWAANQANVKLKFNYTGDWDYWWVIDDIVVSAPASSDLAIQEISFNETSYPVTYLTNPITFSTFCNTTTETVFITVNNAGTSAITSFSAGYSNGSTQAIQTFTIPSLAAGASTQVSFTTLANVDTFDAYFINAWVDMVGDANAANDTSDLAIMIASNPDTITLANPYTTSFEQWPATSPADVPSAWWTAENTNADGEQFNVTFSTANASAGDFALALFGDAGTSATAANDWAFSPCIYFDQTKTYEVSFMQKTGIDGATGLPINESLAFHLCSDDNSLSSVQTIGTMIVNDTVMTMKTFTFSPNASGLFNFGLHKNTNGTNWWMWVDQFSITEVPSVCSAGVISTVGFPTSICPEDSFTISTDGTEATNGEYSLFFSPQATGAGGLGNSFSLTGVSFPYVGNNDLYGVLTGNGYTVMTGEWVVYTRAIDTVGGVNVICDESLDSVSITFLVPGDPGCAAAVPCTPGVLVSSASMVVCSNSNDSIVLDGTESTPGSYTVSFSDAPGGTGGLAGGFNIVNVNTFPWTFDNDIEGLLSSQVPPLAPLSGMWEMTVYNIDASGFICDSLASTISVNFLDSTDALCTPVVACSITDISAGTQTACNAATNTYSQDILVTYSGAPATGTLNVNGQSFAITSSPQTVTLTNLVSNGNALDVSASFSADANCALTLNNVFTAPASCACSITDVTVGQQSPCVNSTNLYTQDVTVFYVNPPATGLLNVNGQTFTITSSPQIVTLTGLNSNGMMVNVNASFTANASCVISLTGMFTAPASCLCPAINVNVTTTNVTNCLSPDGTAMAVATGGSGSYTYSWTPAGSGASLSNIPSGTYTATATDGNGCMGTGSGTVSNASGFSAILDGIPTDVSCNNGNDGVINTQVNGGTGNYTYLWSDQASPSNVGDRNNLEDGTYSVLITDVNSSCTFSLGPVIISEPDALVASVLASQNVSCSGGNDGSIDVTVTGGNGNNTYAWTNGGGNNEDAANLIGGTYTLTVTDAGCPPVSTNPVVISQPNPINIAFDSDNDVTCFNDANGNILVTVTGGNAPLSYSWSNGGGNAEDAQNIGGGTYQLTVTDGNAACGSVNSANFTITEPAELIATIDASSDETCFDAADGSITASISGGTGAMNISWTNSMSTSLSLIDLPPNSYQLSVTDGNNCPATSNIVTIASASQITATASSTEESSSGNDGTASVVASGGTGSYTYLWSPSGQTTAAASGLSAGTYTCVVTDENDCSNTVTVDVAKGTSIGEIALSELLIFPNPSNGTFIVSFETIESLDFEISLFNTIGKEVYANSFDNVVGGFNQQIEVQDLPSGIYFLEIANKDSKSINKITISK